MLKRTCLVFATVATLTAAGTAQAGVGSTPAVFADPTARVAAGSLVGTRNSPDAYSFIECTVNAQDSVSGVMCQAVLPTAPGVKASRYYCASQNPLMVQIALSLTVFDYVTFSWNEKGECTYLGVNKTSAGAPAQ